VLWLSVVVDNACTRVWEAWGTGAQPTSMRVNPAVYEAVAAARPGEVARDCPLMLLGLQLIADPQVATYGPVVTDDCQSAGEPAPRRGNAC
jgi:hypothetical protein